MPLNIEQYDRKPFRVEAVLVTEENIEQVAKWCRGEVRSDVQGDRTVRYVYVDVPNAKSERQKKSMIGEWVLRAGKSFKCYTTKAFDDCFEKPSVELEVHGQEELPLEFLKEVEASGLICGLESADKTTLCLFRPHTTGKHSFQPELKQLLEKYPSGRV